MKDFNDKFKLNNGYEIPSLGFGTCKASGEDSTLSVMKAIEYGYRHIDCAPRYENEKYVGIGIKRALEENDLKREDIFITSKVWKSDMSYLKTIKSFKKTLRDLKVDYLDLYLIHWPISPLEDKEYTNKNLSVWKALTDLYLDGYIKSIGVSNFKKHHLDPLLDSKVKPMVNQIEAHPGFMQDDVRKYCKDNDILVEGWSPLGRGRVMNYPLLKEMAKLYDRDIAQICLRYLLQKDIVPLPKSITPSRIKSNMDIFDFILEDEDIRKLDVMGELGFSGLDPDNSPPKSKKIINGIKRFFK